MDRIRVLSSHLLCSNREGILETNSTASSQVPGEGVALIVGAGPGLSASCARLFSRNSFKVAIACRRPDKQEIQKLSKDFGVHIYKCDVADAGDVKRLFLTVAK